MQWTFRQKRYQELLATPEAERPEGWRTKKQISERLGVTMSTLQAWILLPGWWMSIERIVAPVIGARLHEIYEAMVEQAIGGSVQASRFCRETLGLHKRELDVTIHRDNDDRLVVVVPTLIKPPTPEITAGTPQIAAGDVEAPFIDVAVVEDDNLITVESGEDAEEIHN